MNMWIKFWPLFYTNSTRLNWIKQAKLRWINCFSKKQKLLNIIYYTWDLIASWFCVFMYLLLTKNLDTNSCLIYLLVYSYLYIIFLIFYEIWYIYNDVFSTKKEKNPTKYVEDSLSLNFWKINIFYRAIFGCLLLFSTYFINYNIFYSFSAILIIMWIAFTIHNCIRNYNINIFTRTTLRICKIMIFIIVVKYLLEINVSIIKDIIEAYLIFHCLDFFSNILMTYYKRIEWVTSDRMYSYSWELVLFLSIIFWLILWNPLFFIVPINIYPRVIKNTIIVFKKYWIKSNR